MSPPDSTWQRIRRARLVQIVLVYLGVSWVVLQVVDTVSGLMELPPWVGPVAVLLLGIGLVVVSATALVQSLPRTTAREEAGEVPTDWEVAPADAFRQLFRGRIPHLTWGRAIMGGVMAMSLLFGVAGLYVLLRTPGQGLRPAEAGADEPANGIAVLPFQVTGPDLELYREGMVDLVSANLDGLSDFRAVDARTVLARWTGMVGEDEQPDLDTSLRVAGATGARYAVVGSGVELGSQIRFAASIYDLDSGEKVGEGQVDGSPERVLALVDELTVEVMRALLDATGAGSRGQEFRLASLLTSSVPALRHYLEGDAAFRAADFVTAREAFERAIQEDSTFALAHWRLGDAHGWLDGISSPASRAARQRASELRDRLPPREATLLSVAGAIVSGSVDAEDYRDLRRYLERYPDDPDGWYYLAEIGLHRRAPVGLTDDEVEEALYRQVELDPTFAPYYQHALEWASAKGQVERFDSLFAALRRVSEAEDRDRMYEVRRALMLGDEEEYREFVEGLGELPDEIATRLNQYGTGLLDARLGRLEPYFREGGRRGAVDSVFHLGRLYASQARIDDLIALRDAETRVPAWQELTSRLLDLHAQLGAPSDDVVRRVRDEVRARWDRSPRPPLGALRARVAVADGDSAAMAAALAVMVPGDDGLADFPWDTVGLRGKVAAIVRGTWLAHHGRPDEAYALLTDGGLPSFPGSPFVEIAADFAFRAERWQDAIRLYESVSRISDLRTVAKYRLGVAYEAVGDQQRALDAYRTFLTRTADGDPGIPAVEDARAAVARLGPPG